MATQTPLDSRRPLWTPTELEIITCGRWLRRPDASWAPTCVRAPVVGWSDFVDRGWLSGGIIFVRTEEQLKRLFAEERKPAEAPTGCIAVENQFATSPHLPKHRAVLVVGDHLKAIRALAFAARRRMRGKVLLITGSVGKTTTRSMLAHALSAQGEVVTTVENQNLRPFAFQYMASAPTRCDYVVLELGFGFGAPDAFLDVSDVLQPDLVLLTHLDVAHADQISKDLSSEEEILNAIAEQKLHLARSLKPGGAVVVNADIPIFRQLESRERARGNRVVSFGEADADVRLLAANWDGERMNISAQLDGIGIHFQTKLPAKFMAANSIAALAAAREVGADLDRFTEALATFEAVPGRSRVLDLSIRGARIKLIDDSYNATRLSVRSTLALLESLPPAGSGRRIAILGDIARLGTRSAAVHASLAQDAVRCGVDLVYTYGQDMRHLHEALPEAVAAGHYLDKGEMMRAVFSELRAGDVITVKASLPSGFGEVIRAFELAADRVIG